MTKHIAQHRQDKANFEKTGNCRSFVVTDVNETIGTNILHTLDGFK